LPNYLPTDVKTSIYQINFKLLYEQGKRIILTDIDNTLVPYQTKDAPQEVIDLFTQLFETGYEIYAISNNSSKRVERLEASLPFTGYLCHAGKPSSKKLKKYLLEKQIQMEQCVFVGDQILTDIACANALGITSILVKSICRKTEHWYTKINRMREVYIRNKIKGTNPTLYQKLMNLEKEEEKHE
jgi:HAD superfamily phosphatase (TIGR01668 family)